MHGRGETSVRQLIGCGFADYWIGEAMERGPHIEVARTRRITSCLEHEVGFRAAVFQQCLDTCGPAAPE